MNTNEATAGSPNSRMRWPLTLVAIAALAFGVSLSMAWARLPAPSCHDEFSNLLVADTLRHGRLANPSPAIWQPFQSFHVLVNPSYASKFPLGPGALLAFGWSLLGTPAAGIWIGAALCAVAITWAAAGCMPRRWAALAGLIVCTNPNVHHQWSLSFMNGWLTAAMAALAAGATLRLRKRIRPVDCVLLGVGIGGLALTRPFEGFVFTLTLAGLLLYWWRDEIWKTQLQRVISIAGYATAPLIMTFALLAAHNQAATGSAWQLPYQLHERQYGVAPLSIFQAEKNPQMIEWSADVPPTVLAFHYGWSLESYRKRSHLTGWCGGVAQALHVVSQLWGMVFCVLAASLTFHRTGAHRPIAVALGVALLLASFVPWHFSHYFAPLLVWLVILTLWSVRWTIQRLVRDKASARAALGTLLIIQLVCMGCEIAVANQRILTWADQRQAIVDRLTQVGGQHLILVRYQADHDVHHEWVYNGADLDNDPIVWARSWRPDLDGQLLEHYQGRTVWLLEFDQHDQPILNRW